MCGFVFYINNKTPVDRSLIDLSRDLLSHRGPDAAETVVLREGHVALGHRRLSILDLSKAGNQPMRLGNLWVVFNGEIYNYHDLKRELEQHGCLFRTHCDTEVLLHGYHVWGEELPKHLIGMFSFCLWDDEAGLFFAARDHAGQKPFFYYADGDQLVAASEVKAILPLLSSRPATRRESIKEFLIYDDIPDPHTWYQGVMSLPPGHCLVAVVRQGVGVPSVRSYWIFQPPEDTRDVRFDEAMETFGSLLERSVKMHQLADVEVGAFLSGGLDSSGVVALESSQRSEPVRTFTVGYVGEEGEIPLAREVAKMWGCRHTEMLLDRDGMDAAFDRSLTLFDMPFGDPSQFPTYEVSRLASRDLKVVLTGDGGDEVFGGYWDLKKYMGSPPLDTFNPITITKHLLNRKQRRTHWQASFNFGHSPASQDRVNSWLGPDMADLVNYDALWFYKNHWNEKLDPFRRAQWLDFKSYLPTVLKKVDRCAMANSLETRCPMLLPELIEYAFSLPVSIKNPKGEFKYLYRQWIRRRNLVPEKLHKAPKQGFGVAHPAAKHIRNDPSKMILLKKACDAGWLDSKALSEANDYWSRLWRFALLGRALTS